MSNQFKHIFESANANKKLFDASVLSVREALDNAISKTMAESSAPVMKVSPRVYSTGWLKGSFSYPWVVVCIIVPAILEVIV
ncbi:MAG: hypothetical protein J6U07_03090 [Fibrobacter sp.]|jgi:hypothetical protein|uniref:hypothetical protein n=1 Tax=Fibrobacter sp. UWP2 TaxID=1896216 RepID=UPI000921C012|nr:hypothetical protein [Fibrobacter sp. UWP2]MBO7383585.1 hypothetical protein [Fibrobacter sp.]SHJ41539.1 hypothetical protein SAMN05720471_1376 [Fibrobacter sp. UWP2]